MIYKTKDGRIFYSAPETAVCTSTGKRINDMVECPLVTWDFLDFMCFPETCEYYSGVRTDECP